MTPLRRRMLDALVLHGKAKRTQEAYISAVAQLARHYRRSPDLLSGEQIEAYLVHLLRERQLTRSTVNQAGCAINFLFGKVLGRDGSPCRIPLPHGPQRLPEILSRDEIARLLSCARTLKARTVLSCAYALGLRVSGGVHALLAGSGTVVGRLARAYSIPQGMHCVSARVAAIVVWTREWSQPEYAASLAVDRWEVVVPELVLAPLPPAEPAGT